MEFHRGTGPRRPARLGDPRQRRTIRMTDSTTNIVFLLFPGITQLDFTAPAQALCRMPGAILSGAAASLDPIATDSGFSILPTHDFASAPQADILCIPGGHGVTDALNDSAPIDFIARPAADARWVTRVCTGAFLLGRAGSPAGQSAPPHWADRKGPRLNSSHYSATRISSSA